MAKASFAELPEKFRVNHTAIVGTNR